MRKMWVVLMLFAVVTFAVPRAYAACGGPTPMSESGGLLQCADNVPLAGFAWQISNPTAVNSGSEKIVCEAFDGSVCFDTTGGLGDGIVSIETDWANPTIVGCPVAGTTANRVAIAVQATDGRGVLLSVSGNTDEFTYQLDMAHPYDDATGVFTNLSCASANGRPLVTSVTSSSIGLKFNKPHIFSDCDAGTFGAFVAPFTSKPVCPDAFNGDTSVALGNIYTSVQRCDTRPLVSRSQTQFPWTVNAVVPAADGTATIPFTKPAADTDCLYVGGTVRILGTETNSITGFVRIQGGLAPAPQALNVRAAFANGKVNVSFDTDSELGLAAINVLTTPKGGKGDVKVGSVALQGVGGSGASYKTSFGKGDFKGGDSVVIELVTNDGRTTRSNAVRF